MKQVFILLSIFFFKMISFSDSFQDRFINPDGWKLPDFNKMNLVGNVDPKSLKIDINIQIDNFDVKEEFEPYLFYDKYIDYKKDVVYLNVEKERKLEYLKTYKQNDGKIVLYEINCFFTERIVHKKKFNQFSVSKIEYGNQYFIADFDQDGIYESCFETIDYKFIEKLLKVLLNQKESQGMVN